MISGAKTPAFLEQLAPSAKPYFAKLEKFPANLRRPISPSYHIQFSEALANFANHLAGEIVRQHHGQLLYAGGDDVLAMLPADQALACAQALRDAFRGTTAAGDPNACVTASSGHGVTPPGFMRAADGHLLIVPGPNADVSVGIAIGHMNHPLQALVREAQAAEKRAKNNFARAAFAVSLLKRGGETIHWGGKWDSAALSLYNTYCGLRGRTKDEKEKSPVSGKFPYALAALLKPYALEKGEFTPGLNPGELILQEFAHVLQQQAGGLPVNQKTDLAEQAIHYLAQLTTAFGSGNGRKAACAEFTNLFLTAAFIERSRSGEE